MNCLSQATRGKEEVTAELAKILTVLQTTLTANNGEDDDESDSSDESLDSSEEDEDQATAGNATGKQSTPPTSADQVVETSNNAPVPPLVGFDFTITIF